MRLGPLRHRWFAAFTGSIGLGGLGDEVARLALPILILDLTHSIAAAATLRLVQALPYVFFGGIAGVLIDRTDKRRLLIGCDLLSVALTLAIPVSVAVGVFSLNLLYVIGFLLGTVEVAWGVTTDFSVVPALVEPDELTSANAAYFGVDRSARNLGQQGVQTLVLYVLREENQLSGVTIGLALSLAGVVTVLASFIAPRLAQGRPLGHTLLGSTALAGLVMAATALAHDWRLIVAGYAARETAWMGFIIYAFVPRQREVPARIRGRANRAFRTIVIIANSVSAPFLSAIVVWTNSATAFAVAGASALLAVAVTYFTPLRDYNLNEPTPDERVDQAAK